MIDFSLVLTSKSIQIDIKPKKRLSKNTIFVCLFCIWVFSTLTKLFWKNILTQWVKYSLVGGIVYKQEVIIELVFIINQILQHELLFGRVQGCSQYHFWSVEHCVCEVLFLDIDVIIWEIEFDIKFLDKFINIFFISTFDLVET